MVVKGRRLKRQETIASVLLLIVLFFIGLGVFVKQFRFDLAQYGLNADAVINSDKKPETENPLLDWQQITVDGYKLLGTSKTYTAENLFEKINGKAPLYIDAGFEKLITQRLVSSADEEQIIEVNVYDMGGIRNAFSVYSQQKRPEAEDLNDVKIGYQTSNGIYFVCGKYYVEMVGFSESKELFEAMLAVTANLKSALPCEGEIEELKFFKGDGWVKGSVKFYLSGAFGFEKLTDTFAAKYQSGDEKVTAFLSKRADAEEAEKLAQEYVSFLVENGATVEKEIEKGKVLDFYGTKTIIFNVDRYAGGIHQAENMESAEKAAVNLQKILKDAVEK